VREAERKSERLRTADTGEKTGVFTGAYAVHPVTGAEIPIWIADYVLAGYGTGAIMAVPGHDERDWAFARRFGLPIVEVVSGGDVDEAAYVGDGAAVNSDFLDGLATPDAKRRMIEWLEANGRGEAQVTYKLRDWLFSRQRYWGEPFPLIHLEDGTTKLLPLDELPLLLPELDDFKPTGDFRSPLERVPEWIETTDPETGRPAKRDPNTMPQWAGSCWYYLRFCDPRNEDQAWSPEAERYWMPVDLYVGGAEHAVLHLLYARFWHKVLYDLGHVHTKEPFQRLVNQGMVQGYSYRYYDDNLADDPEAETHAYPASQVRIEGERAVAVPTGAEVKARYVQLADVRFDADGTPLHPTLDDLPLEEVSEKMSKSRGNVLSPDEVVADVGADAMRLYEMFMGPLEKGAPWSTEGIQGVHRFLQKTWRTFVDEDAPGEPVRDLPEGPGSEEQQRLLARTIDGVTRDFDELGFNTAISKLMVLLRDGAKDEPWTRDMAEAFVLMLSPMAPHLAEELWRKLGHEESLAHEEWPEADPALLVEDTITLAVQVNGKRRDEIQVPADASKEAIEAAALAREKVRKFLGDGAPKKVIVVPGRLVNLVG
jgi:leucyl-tRNA synthetase